MSTVIDEKPIVWIASYPRSGNTFLRMILWHCFGLRSTSLYPGDLGGNRQLEAYVGHIERQEDCFMLPKGAIPLVKTHELNQDDNPAIYIVRDGRAACVSTWIFNNRKDSPLEEFLEGRNMVFGPWGDHVRSWHPWDRPQTLLLKYEELSNNLPSVLSKLADFLDREILSRNIPDRNTVAQIDGKIVTKQSDWRSVLSGPLLERFNQVNRDLLERFGYLQRAELKAPSAADESGSAEMNGSV